MTRIRRAQAWLLLVLVLGGSATRAGVATASHEAGCGLSRFCHWNGYNYTGAFEAQPGSDPDLRNEPAGNLDNTISSAWNRFGTFAGSLCAAPSYQFGSETLRFPPNTAAADLRQYFGADNTTSSIHVPNPVQQQNCNGV